jgi:DNA replication protein DnaC
VPEPHASSPATDGRPTLAQIEAAAAANPPLPPEQRGERPPAPRAEPDATVVDWRAHVEAIAARSRPARQKAAAERTDRQRRIDDARRERVVAATLGRLDRRFGRFADATLAGGSATARAAIALGRGQIDGIVIRGPVGTGKTHEAVAAFRYLVERRGMVPAIAVAVPALLDGLRPGREPVESLSACESARLLLLDDLAAERATDWTAETLYRLIDARYARKLPTIVTTIATGELIRANLGDRIASRLNGLGMVVTLDGPDRRAPTEH